MTAEARIQPIIQYLQENGFILVKESQYSAHLQSDSTTFRFGRDPRENSYSIYVGIKDSELVELCEQIYEEVFGISFTHTAFYANDFIEFLKTAGRGLLVGDDTTFQQLIKSYAEITRVYNYKRLKHQTLNYLEKLWKEKDYKTFMFEMDKSDKSMLPNFYSLRYKIAAKKSSTNDL